MTDRPITLADVRAIPHVGDAERLELRPGDLVTVRLTPGTHDDEVMETAERLSALLDGTGVKVIVVEGDAHIDVRALVFDDGETEVTRTEAT